MTVLALRIKSTGHYYCSMQITEQDSYIYTMMKDIQVAVGNDKKYSIYVSSVSSPEIVEGGNQVRKIYLRGDDSRRHDSDLDVSKKDLDTVLTALRLAINKIYGSTCKFIEREDDRYYFKV